MLFSNRFCHKFKEAVFISCGHGVIKFPVHFKLAIGIFMIILIRTPPKIEHVITNLFDHIIPAHHRLLVIAWLFSCIIWVGNLVSIRRQQKILSLNPSFYMHAFSGSLVNQTLQHIARSLINLFAFHHTIRRDPCDIWLPWQFNNRCRIRHRQHIWMSWRKIQPCRKPGKSSPILLHFGNSLCRHQFCTLSSEQVGERDHKIFDTLFFGIRCEINCHFESPCLQRYFYVCNCVILNGPTSMMSPAFQATSQCQLTVLLPSLPLPRLAHINPQVQGYAHDFFHML